MSDENKNPYVLETEVIRCFVNEVLAIGAREELMDDDGLATELANNLEVFNNEARETVIEKFTATLEAAKHGDARDVAFRKDYADWIRTMVVGLDSQVACLIAAQDSPISFIHMIVSFIDDFMNLTSEEYQKRMNSYKMGELPDKPFMIQCCVKSYTDLNKEWTSREGATDNKVKKSMFKAIRTLIGRFPAWRMANVILTRSGLSEDLVDAASIPRALFSSNTDCTLAAIERGETA